MILEIQCSNDPDFKKETAGMFRIIKKIETKRTQLDLAAEKALKETGEFPLIPGMEFEQRFDEFLESCTELEVTLKKMKAKYGVRIHYDGVSDQKWRLSWNA